MSSFLWIEDFEGGQYREFAFKLFGEALDLSANDFGETEAELKLLLAKNNIQLITNLADGIRFINDETKLRKIDFVILDIDLALMGIDLTEDESQIKPVLQKWYKYSPLDSNEEQSFNRACDELKRVAGYHLYIDLVINLRFPRDRILFCSNHGSYLKAIQDSFSGAKIDYPKVLAKADPDVSRTIVDFYSNEYSDLRRAITSICDEVVQAIRFNQIRFTLPTFIQKEKGSLDITDGAYIFGMLPLLLPPYPINTAEQSLIFRQFVRALTQDFDKINFKTFGENNHKIYFFRLLHSVRNWVSHDSRAMQKLNVSDVAYLFLIFLQTCFKSKHQAISSHEDDLLKLVGPVIKFEEAKILESLKVVSNSVTDRATTLSDDEKVEFDRSPYLNKKINILARNSKLTPGEHEKFMYQIFWYQIIDLNKNESISPQSFFNDKDGMIFELKARVYEKAFSGYSIS